MNIHEHSLGELTSYPQARRHTVDVVLDELPEEVLVRSLLSGFDAGTCLDGDRYEPIAEGIKSGVLFAVPPEGHYLSWVGHYAVSHSYEPAVGVYDASKFDTRFNGVGYVVNSGLTVVDACTDIFVWR